MGKQISETYKEYAKSIARNTKSGDISDITLSGSVSRGVASKYSDIELDLWCDVLPSKEEMISIVQKATSNPAKFIEEDTDGSCNITSTYESVEVEFTWQSYDNFMKLLDSVYKDLDINHFTFVYFWTVKNHIHLSGSGKIEKIRKKLDIYPEKLSTKIIKRELEESMQNPETRISDLHRNELWSLNLKISKQITSSLTYLYALNRKWEPYWKWITHTVNSELTISPDNLSERINSLILGMCEPNTALKESFELYIEVLELLKANEETVPKDLYQEKINLITQCLSDPILFE